jgi:hypothetical protein
MLIAAMTVAMFLSKIESDFQPIDHTGLVLSATLTEQDVVTMSTRAGLKITTSNPKAVVSDEKVKVFFEVFGSNHRWENGNGKSKGKGKKKGHRSESCP